ncbi:MAG: LamG domain-containing protein [Candidatus Neomarinimicrobiota bacterium]
MRKTHIFKSQREKPARQSQILRRAVLSIGLSAMLWAGPKTVLHINGTYDLDQDGLSELLLVVQQPDGGTRLEYVEIDKSQQHQLLWSFSPPVENRGLFTDVKMTDLDGTGFPELVGVLQAASGSSAAGQSWLYIFKWTGQTFIPAEFTITDTQLARQLPRPGNLCFLKREAKTGADLAVSLGAPLREILILSPAADTKTLEFSVKHDLQPGIFRNGFGRVYSMAFNDHGRQLLAVFSPEGNVLKTAVYRFDPKPVELVADILAIDGARFLQAAEIMTTDFDADGNEELLLPFRSGEVFLLALREDKLVLELSDLNGGDLFNIPDPADSRRINDMVIARVEAGLYTTLKTEPVKIASVSKQELEAAAEIAPGIDLIPSDTIDVGEIYQVSVLDDTAAEFFSFQWLKNPPAGIDFDPVSGLLNWTPQAFQAGPHLLAYKIEQRIGEKVLMVEEAGGARHQIVPVLAEKIREYAVLVKAPALPVMETKPGARLVGELELYSVAALLPEKQGDSRFIFEGVPPFGLTTAEIADDSFNRSLIHSITADLSRSTSDRQLGFAYRSTAVAAGPVTTFSVIHDLETNLIALSFAPAIETIQQSLNPEDLFNELYLFPEYFFSGFPAATGIDLLGDKLQFTISEDTLSQTAQLSFVGITSPTMPAHLLTLYFNRGELKAIRGDIRVQPSGGKKIVTEFDFTGQFNPVRISTQLRERPAIARESLRPSISASDLLFVPPLPRTTKRQPVTVVQADSNYSLEFTPGGYVKIYDNPVFDFSAGELTVEGLVYLTGRAQPEGIISKDNTFRLALNSSGQLEFRTARDSISGVTLIAPGPLPRDRWVHIAGVQDSVGMRLYVDGRLVASNTIPGAIYRSTAPLFIGGWELFSGLVDEVRLSAQGRYAEEFEPEFRYRSDDTTLGLWHFDSGNGFLVPDASGFGNTGEIFGAGWSRNVPEQAEPLAEEISDQE